MKKAAADENMHTRWSGIQDQLVKFLEDLPEDVRGLGREVADLYGRCNPDKFRGVLVLRSEALLRRVEWEKLVLCNSSTMENGLGG